MHYEKRMRIDKQRILKCKVEGKSLNYVGRWWFKDKKIKGKVGKVAYTLDKHLRKVKE